MSFWHSVSDELERNAFPMQMKGTGGKALSGTSLENDICWLIDFGKNLISLSLFLFLNDALKESGITENEGSCLSCM